MPTAQPLTWNTDSIEIEPYQGITRLCEFGPRSMSPFRNGSVSAWYSFVDALGSLGFRCGISRAYISDRSVIYNQARAVSTLPREGWVATRPRPTKTQVQPSCRRLNNAQTVALTAPLWAPNPFHKREDLKISNSKIGTRALRTWGNWNAISRDKVGWWGFVAPIKIRQLFLRLCQSCSPLGSTSD